MLNGKKQFFDCFTLQDLIVHEGLEQTAEPTVPVETLGQTGQDSNPSERENLDAQQRGEVKSTEESPLQADDAEGVDSGFWGQLYEADYPRDEETSDDYIWCKFILFILFSGILFLFWKNYVAVLLIRPKHLQHYNTIKSCINALMNSVNIDQFICHLCHL